MKYDEIIFKLNIGIYYTHEELCVSSKGGEMYVNRVHPTRFQFINITCEVSIMIDTSKKYLHFTFGKKWSVRVVRYVETKNGFYIKPLKSIK